MQLIYLLWANPIDFVFGLPVTIVAVVVDHENSTASLASFELHIDVQDIGSDRSLT